MSTKLMRFDARDLPEGAEPVPISSLKEGAEYFSVQYVDERLLIPIIETWVYAGKGLDLSEPDLLHFQDVGSYREGIRYGTLDADKASFQVGWEGGLRHMFDFEHALNELMKCSLRRARIRSANLDDE